MSSSRLVKYSQVDASGSGVTAPIDFLSMGIASLSGICCDPTGNLYVTDPEAKLVVRANESGQSAVYGLSGEFSDPRGIACDRSGNIYVADVGTRSVRKIDNAGTVTTVASGFLAPVSIAVLSNGDVAVADAKRHKIYKATSVGTANLIAGSAPGDLSGEIDGHRIVGDEAQFDNPISIASDRADNIWVVDYNNAKLKKVTPDGWVIAFASDDLVHPVAVATNRSGEVFVADREGDMNVIKKIDPGDNSVHFVANAGSNNILGLAIDPSGEIYVAETTFWKEEASSASSAEELRLEADDIQEVVLTNDKIEAIYTGSADTSTTLVVNGVAFIVGNVNGHFVWDIGGATEHVFEYVGETITVDVGGHMFVIQWDGFGSLAFSIQPFSVRKLYVCTTGDDDSDGLTPTTAKATIQSAIDAASEGDEVLVLDGTYLLGEPLQIDKNVSVLGVSAGAELQDNGGFVGGTSGWVLSGAAAYSGDNSVVIPSHSAGEIQASGASYVESGKTYLVRYRVTRVPQEVPSSEDSGFSMHREVLIDW